MGDSTQGNGAPEAPQGSEGTPSASITQDDLNRAINSAITGRLKEFGQKFESKLSAFDADKLAATLEERFSSKFAPAAKGKDDNAKPVPIHETPEFRSIKKELDQLRKERDAEVAKARDYGLAKAATNVALSTSFDQSVTTPLVEWLAKTGRIRYASDQSDSMIFVDDDGEEVDLKTGFETFKKTELGKRFLPARGVQGSGDRPQQARGGVSNQTQKQPVTPEAMGAELLRMINGNR